MVVELLEGWLAPVGTARLALALVRVRDKDEDEDEDEDNEDEDEDEDVGGETWVTPSLVIARTMEASDPA